MYIALLAMLAASLLFGMLVYSMLPDVVASHWNAEGKADGYSSKTSFVLLMPAIMLVTSLILILVPRLDPRRKNIEQFQEIYNGFVVFIAFFLFYIHSLSLLYNLGMIRNIILWIIPIFAALSFYLGFLMKKNRPNWFIGIRTPWTLTSDHVWYKTHNLASKLFAASGFIILIGLLLPALAIFLMVIPLLLITLYLCVYSYIEYHKETDET